MGCCTEGISTDGLAWTYATEPPSRADWIEFGNGKFLKGRGELQARFLNGEFIVPEGEGYLRISGDGINWKRVGKNTTSALTDIQFFNGTYTAHGILGEIYYSTDKIRWTQVPGVTAFGRLKASPLGFRLLNGERVLSSSTGETWKVEWVRMLHLWQVTFAKGAFMAEGKLGESKVVLRSTDGERLERLVSDQPWLAAAEGNGRVVTIRPGGLWYSTDGSSWKQANSPGVRAVAFGNGMFLALGQEGGILRSVTGENWELLSDRNFAGIAHAAGRFLFWRILPALPRDEADVLPRQSPDRDRRTEFRTTLDGANWDTTHIAPHPVDTVEVAGERFVAWGNAN